VTVSAEQRAGSGGDGLKGAFGTDGVASVMNDAVSGSTGGELTLKQLAYAGSGGNGDELAGNGGDASTSLTATNPGGGDLDVSIGASGGHGGEGSLDSHGGDASASLTARGVGEVRASASALGGWGLSGSGGAARGGDATATASAIGGGAVDVSATANGGRGDWRGNARARASGTGSSGTASARTSTAGDVIESLGVRTTSTIAGSADVEARVRIAGLASFPPPDRGLTGITIGVGLPSDEEVAHVLAGNPNAQAGLMERRPLGMMMFAANEDVSSIILGGRSDFTIARESLTASDDRELVLAFVNATVLGDFEELSFRVQKEYETLLDETFTDSASALAFFDDQVIRLGDVLDGVVRDLDLSLIWSLTSAEDATSISVTALFGIVPEPGTALIVFEGLLMLGLLRRRRGRFGAH
jgi:hypothetical protein